MAIRQEMGERDAVSGVKLKVEVSGFTTDTITIAQLSIVLLGVTPYYTSPYIDGVKFEIRISKSETSSKFK